MWMGELITKRGVGNGISLLIFASILAYAPTGISAWINGGTTERLFFPIVAVAVVLAVVFVQEGQRRIPVQYARRQLGNRQTAGGSTYMPLRVNMAGVIPVIFAAALLALPQTVAGFVPAWSTWVNANFQYTSWWYLATEAVLIIVFTYFYTSVQFNPVDQADNLRKYGGYIPGIRPGPPTAAYLDRVLQRLTLPGSLFLATVAVAPSIFIHYFGFSQATARALGGTSVLIVVGVALDTMRQMESQMMMRHYEGLPALNVLVLGPQGSGKGTQAKKISATYGIPHIATGDMLRAMKELPTDLGRRAQADLRPRRPRAGRAHDQAHPRAACHAATRSGASSSTASRARWRRRRRSTRCSHGLGRDLDVVFELQVPDRQQLLDRMLKRAAEEGRSDDTPEAIARRLRDV